MSKSKPKEHNGRFRPQTVRFTREEWELIHDVATANNLSQAELIRMVVANTLKSFLKTIRIVDAGQAKEIQSAILSLYNETGKIAKELHRIGTNVNQLARSSNIEQKHNTEREHNIEQKYPLSFDLDKIEQRRQAMLKEQKELKEQERLKKQEIQKKEEKYIAEFNALITRYEAATKEVGDLLCRILG